MELTGRECASLPDFIFGGGNFLLVVLGVRKYNVLRGKELLTSKVV